MDNLTVVQANELVEASYNLSINELRVVAIASTKVDSRKRSIGEIKISVDEFRTAYGLEKDNSIYSALRDAVRSLMRKPVRLFSGDRVIELAWLQMNEYSVGIGSHVIIEFSPKIEPYLFELKERFTAINFEFAAKLNTPFSFRLYQWLYKAKKLNKHKKNQSVEVVLSVEWMKSQVAIAGEYERWDNFNCRLIRPSIEKINAHTDLSVIYEPVKEGRKVTAVRFSYVVETERTSSKPLRPRLFRRPKVVKGSHAEGEWMRKNLSLLLEYERALSAYDPSAKLALADLRKMAEYASIAEPELQRRLESEIKQREIKRDS